MGIENLNTDLSAKQAILKKVNYDIEKNGADINDNDVEIKSNAEEQVTTNDNITSTSGEITTVKKDKSGIKAEIDALKDCLNNDNADEELRKERLLQIKDLEVSLDELDKLEDELNQKKEVEEKKLKKQKADKQVLDKKNETLKAEKKDLEQQKVQAEKDVETAKQAEAQKKEQPEEKKDSTISNTQSTYNSVAGTLISNYADETADLLEAGSKAGKAVKIAGKAAGYAGSAIDASGAVVDYLKGNKTGAEAAEAVGWAAADVAISKVPIVGTVASTIGTENIVNEYVEVTDEKEDAAKNRIAMMQEAGIDADTAETIDTISDKSIEIMSSVFLTKELRVVAGAAERKITSVVEEFSPETAQTIHNGWQVVEDVTSMDPKKMARAAKKIENKVESVTKSVKSAVSTGVNKAKTTAKKVAKTVLPTSVYNAASSAYHKIKSWF